MSALVQSVNKRKTVQLAGGAGGVMRTSSSGAASGGQDANELDLEEFIVLLDAIAKYLGKKHVCLFYGMDASERYSYQPLSSIVSWEEGLRRGYDKNASHFKPKKYEKAFPKALAEAIAEHAKRKEQRSGGGEPSCDGDAPGGCGFDTQPAAEAPVHEAPPDDEEEPPPSAAAPRTTAAAATSTTPNAGAPPPRVALAPVAGDAAAFHAPQDGDAVGFAAIRGHGSAKGVPSACLSLNFLEKRAPNGRWVEDKQNPHRRMVMEGRMGYWELLVRLNGAEARWEVIGPYEESLANLQADDSKAEKIDSLTEGQKQSLEWVAGAMGIWKDPRGVTAAQVANAKLQAANRIATSAEVQTTRKQLLALHKLQLLTKQKVSNADYFSIRG